MDDIRIENFLYPYVRFFNAAPGGGNVDFYIGNTLAASNISFGNFSPYIKVIKGRQDFRITRAGNKDDVLARLTLNFSDGEVYTVAAVSDRGRVLAYGINEPVNRDNLNYGHIRICQLSPDLGKADVIANQYEILREIDYLEISRYICISPGRYDFNIRRTGTQDNILNVSAQTMRPGIYNTLYIVGLVEGTPKIQGILSVDAASYNGYYL